MKQSEMLRRQADMMDMAEKYEIDDWRKLVQARSKIPVGVWATIRVSDMASFNHHDYDVRYALGVVEGKPVFEGDTLYVGGDKVFASDSCDLSYAGYSWNPPKPKTVMVELPESYVRKHAALSGCETTLVEACRKALGAQSE